MFRGVGRFYEGLDGVLGRLLVLHWVPRLHTHNIHYILHGVPKASVRGRLDCLRHAERFQSGLLLKSSRPLILELSDVPMRQTYCYMLRPHNAPNALE